MSSNRISALFFSLLVASGYANLQAQPSFVPLDRPAGGTIQSIIMSQTGKIFAGGSSPYRIFVRGGPSYVSVDHGVGWKLMPDSASPYGFVITSHGMLVGHGSGEIYRSTDDGASWAKNFGPPNVGIRSLVLGLNDELFLLCGSSPNDSRILFRSTDLGVTWEGYAGDDPFYGIYSTLAVTRAPNNYLFLAPSGSSRSGGVLRTTNDGDNWYYPNNAIRHEEVIMLKPGLSEGELFAGTLTKGLFRSIDYAETWTRLDSAVEPQIIWSILVLDSTSLFIGTDKGIYYSSDHGATWNPRNTGLTYWRVLSLARGRSEGELYAGTHGGGVFYSSNLGQVWEQRNSGMNVYAKVIGAGAGAAVDANGILYFAADNNAGVFRSTDQGNSWSHLSNGLPTFEATGFVLSSFCLMSNASGSIFLNTQSEISNVIYKYGFYRSLDGGNTWQSVPSSMTDSTFVPWNVFAGPDGNGLYFMHYPDGLYYSSDDGETWTRKENVGLTSTYGFAFTFDHRGYLYMGEYDTSNLFRSTDFGDSWTKIRSGQWLDEISAIAVNSQGDIFFSTGFDRAIYRSTDDGTTWAKVLQFGFAETEGVIYSLFIDRNDHLYAGSLYEDGLYLSTDNGDTWTQPDSSWRGFSVRGISMDSAGYLYAATSTGFMRSVNPITSIEDQDKLKLPHVFSLSQNYPNPFNPTTKFEVSIPKYEFVTVRICNLLGEEVATLVNEMKQPGTYTVSWDGSKYPSGVYFYTMTAGSFRETKKLVLVR